MRPSYQLAFEETCPIILIGPAPFGISTNGRHYRVADPLTAGEILRDRNLRAWAVGGGGVGSGGEGGAALIIAVANSGASLR